VAHEVLAEEVVMAWTAHSLPHPVAPNQVVTVWTAARNRVLADLALARGEWELAAYYIKRASVCAHEEALQQDALAATGLAPAAT
jgi:hypothetical protein